MSFSITVTTRCQHHSSSTRNSEVSGTIVSTVLKFISFNNTNVSKESNVSQFTKFVSFKQRSFVSTEHNIVSIVVKLVAFKLYIFSIMRILTQ